MGSESEIARRQTAYLPDLESLLSAPSSSALDIGSGRGEWLHLLRDKFPNVAAEGVDTNAIFVEESRSTGINVAHGDALTRLHNTSDATYDLITMFHVAEHLPLQELDHMCADIARVLKPGGLFICETPNCASLSVGASTFWIDPTHPRPLHPEVLQFVVQRAGFSHVEVRLMHPITPTTIAEGTEQGSVTAEIVAAIWGHGDIAVVARR